MEAQIFRHVVTIRSNFAVVKYDIMNNFAEFKHTRISRKHEIEIMCKYENAND